MCSNYPPDWNWYMNTCPFCGRNYHQSEYGCICTEEWAPCACGANDWIWDETEHRAICAQCRTEPGQEEKMRSKSCSCGWTGGVPLTEEQQDEGTFQILVKPDSTQQALKCRSCGTIVAFRLNSLGEWTWPEGDLAKFVALALATGRLVQEKNAAYGDSVRTSGKIMQLLYPNGISVDQIPSALVTVRILDKLSRIANDPKFGGEDPAQDITGYGLLLQDLVKNGL